MKRYIIAILAAITATAAVYGQPPGDFDALFRKYSGQENYTTIELTGALLQMITGDRDGSFAGLSSLKLITTRNGEALDREVRAVTDRNGFKSLMNINEGGGGLEILYREKDTTDQATQYVMLAVDGAGLTVICLVGDIDFHNLARLAKIDVGGPARK